MFVCLQQTTYTWMTTLKVMRHSDGHIIRLAGDMHLEGCIEEIGLQESIAQEKFFLQSIAEPLAHFLDLSLPEKEYFVVEKIVHDLLQNIHLLQSLLLSNAMVVPLITRMNILGHQQINLITKSLAATINGYKLQQKIKIIPYDIRSKYLKLCSMSFPNTQQEYDCFYKELIFHKNLFIFDIQKQLNNKNAYNQKFCDYIMKKGIDLIAILNNELEEIEDFFTYTFADFGYLTFIAQHADKNVTLYLGANHCYNLAQDLEKIGYKTLFEKNYHNFQTNAISASCSKKEYQIFFTIK